MRKNPPSDEPVDFTALSSLPVLFDLSVDSMFPRALRTINSGGSLVFAFLGSGAISFVFAALGRFVLVFADRHPQYGECLC